MKKNKIILLVIGILVLCGGVLAGILLVQNNQNIARFAAPATTMSITPASQSSAQGGTISFSVTMDTGTNAVTGVDVRLKFDPNAIQITSLTQGSGVINLNQQISNTYDNAAGTISYAIFTLNSSQSITGAGKEVLQVDATVKANAPPGNYSITFDPATAASASQEGQNVITSKSPGTIVVTTATGPTPTATATTRATATATARATATATSVATASPTPVPGTTNTPTPVPTATTSATNQPTNQPTATATAMPIPETGTSWVTVAGVAVGLFAIFGAVLLAL